MSKLYDISSEEEAADIIRAISNEWGLATKIWQRGDILSTFQENYPDNVLTEEEVDKLIAGVYDGYGFCDYLEEATEHDWENIAVLIEEEIDWRDIDRDRLA